MDEEQFDNFLGGSQELPHEAGILKIAAARASEIAAMTNSLENPQHNKLIFQKLPRHMRRRVMSHKVKRMPRRLQESHFNQMSKSGLPSKEKRPSRKYRRRPRNLLQEYNRRKRNKFWLETHIWHAKRFKMIEKWGFKLAEHPNDKCFRANYRAVVSHSLIQDISYYTCLEISGSLKILISFIQEHCDPSFNIKNESLLKGEKEGEVMFYKKGGFPNFPLGNVNFMWKPKNLNQTNESDQNYSNQTIWLWIHPGSYQDIFYEIVSYFNFELISVSESNENFEKEDYEDVEKMPSAFKISKEIEIPLFKNKKGCEMMVLRNSLNRFRICGPLALSVLTDALKLPKIEMVEKMVTDEEKNTEENISNFWHRIFYSNPENLEAFNVQKSIFEKLKELKSSNQVPDNSIIALTVLDPRFFLPEKRTKSLQNVEKTEETCLNKKENLVSDLANRSGIWETKVRTDIRENFLFTSQIQEMRKKVLIPGMENDRWFDEEKVQKIPILLIQKPGIQRPGGVTQRRSGFGSGYDIIIPSGWALPFWLSFIYRCVRVGGLRESRSIIFETLNLSTPDIFHPGTPAYNRESLYRKQKLKEEYFKYPPNRRVNYVKFAITSPFFCEWAILTKEWEAEGDFFTLRNNALLRNLDENLTRRKKRKGFLKSENFSEIQPLPSELENKNYLIPVKVTIERKGVSEDFAIICLPTEEDLELFKKNRKWSGPIETSKSDPNEKERTNSRKTHLALLKRLRKQRVRRQKKLKSAEDCEDDEFLDLKNLINKKLMNSNKMIIEEQARRMENLCLPECNKVRFSCDREVMGFIEQGAFCLSEAKGTGRGYIVLKPLIDLIQKKRNLVLIRNTQSRQYRFANLEVLVT